MIVCDYCGKDCSPDHAEFKLEAYRWGYVRYDYDAKNTLHLHRRCYEEILNTIRLTRNSSLGTR